MDTLNPKKQNVANVATFTTTKQNKKMLDVIEGREPTREELLKKWTTEVITILMMEGKLKGIIRVDEFVKSKLKNPPIYQFYPDESEKESVCKWIEQDILVLQKCLDMISKGKATKTSFSDFEKMFLW